MRTPAALTYKDKIDECLKKVAAVETKIKEGVFDKRKNKKPEHAPFEYVFDKDERPRAHRHERRTIVDNTIVTSSDPDYKPPQAAFQEGLKCEVALCRQYTRMVLGHFYPEDPEG